MHSLHDNVVTSACRTIRTVYADVPSSRITNCIYENEVEKWRFYFREAICQLDYAKRSYAEFEKAKQLNDTFTIFYNLHHFIIHITNVDKLLDIKSGTFREAVLKNHMDMIDVDLKPIRRLRNHLEHFDERLDTWIQNHDGHTFFDNNIITGTIGFPDQIFLRALDGDVFKFYGEAFPLVPIFKSAKRLHSYLIDLEKS